MNLKDFIKAKEKLNNQFRKGEISQQELSKAMTKLRNSRDAAKKGRLEKTPFGRFMNWLTTPAPLSQIIEPLKGPALKKKAASGSKGGPGRPAGTGQKPAAKKSPTKKSGITAPTSKGIYTIKSGDTLSQIAKTKGTTVIALKNANNIKDADKIRAGRKLIIPAHAGPGRNPYAGMRAKKKAPKMSTAEMEAKLKKMSDDLMKAKRRPRAK